ncbi:hypothetical protein BT96DRAFT_997938 [Gymnopus androsaceus JB14]|uniref:Uncharacterized protein n=1 Tax=Gymnopus androsaceus JB14 TaxID=1447944 RepID=A0A6A4HBE4_9AGAR|nr:hypothetical protein BT96DRAFT_997938 [Gymnopus androsaceus JB14]
MSMDHYNNQVCAAFYFCNCPSAFNHRIFEDPAATILATPSDPEASAFIIKGQVIPPSSTYSACLAEWFPTHPQVDFTFADGWHLHTHCFFLAHALRCFEAQVGTNEAHDLPTALAEFMIHLEPSLNYIFTNWIACINCPTFAVFHYCLAFCFLADHTFPHFHTFWLDPLNLGADFLQVVQARIRELGVTTAMPTPIPFDPSTAEGCHLALLLPPQDLEVFPPALLAPRNIVSAVSVPPPPKVDPSAEPAAATSVSTTTRVRMPPKATASTGTLPISPKVTRSVPHFEGRPHKVAPKQPLVILKATCHAAASKLTCSASNSSANGDSEEEEDELKCSPPKRSTVSCKHCHLPSVASSNPLEVSSPKSEAPIAKKIPVTRSTIAKANLTYNPKGKQKAHACSTSIEISAPTERQHTQPQRHTHPLSMPSEGSSTSHHEGAGSHQEQAEHAHEQRSPNHALQVNPNDLSHVKMAKIALNKLPNELVEKISTQHNLDLHGLKNGQYFSSN